MDNVNFKIQQTANHNTTPQSKLADTNINVVTLKLTIQQTSKPGPNPLHNTTNATEQRRIRRNELIAYTMQTPFLCGIPTLGGPPADALVIQQTVRA